MEGADEASREDGIGAKATAGRLVPCVSRSWHCSFPIAGHGEREIFGLSAACRAAIVGNYKWGARSSGRKPEAAYGLNARLTVGLQAMHVARGRSRGAARPGAAMVCFFGLNPTRMHVVTRFSDKYEAMCTAENGWSVQEAGMAQLDGIVGSVVANADRSSKGITKQLASFFAQQGWKQ